MLISFVFVAVIAAAGMIYTYLIFDDEPFLWRIAVGNVLGAAVFGTVLFLTGLAVGMTIWSVGAAILISVAPAIVLVRRPGIAARSHLDWQRAKGRLQGGSFAKFLGATYYAGFILLFILFFAQAMYETGEGIFTGGYQNLGDLSLHLGAIFSFSDANNFPPQNPSFAGARFSYPFIADLLAAAMVKLGATVQHSMLVQDVSWAFSLLVVLERFVLKLTGDRLTSKLGPALLFFSGGLGFVQFFADAADSAKPLGAFLWSLPTDYTRLDPLSLFWGNSMTVLFITQRSILLGMPIALALLELLWKQFVDKADSVGRRQMFLAGLLAGLLPLVHLHSLFVLFVVTAFLLASRPDRWRWWTAFGLGSCITGLPELLWAMTGTASSAGEFIGLISGWSRNDENFFWFWLINTGVAIPLLIGGLYLFLNRGPHPGDEPRAHKKAKAAMPLRPDGKWVVLFYAPFAFLFVLCNIVRFAPSEWDNIKVLIYWYTASIPFIAYSIVWLWRSGVVWRVAASVIFLAVTLSGALDVWRTMSGAVKTQVFGRQAKAIAEQIKVKTEPRALFVNLPTYNTAVALSGRLSLMRYDGHLYSHGINYGERETDIRNIYAGSPDAGALIAKYGVDYILVSPEERGKLSVNDVYFSRFPVAAEAGPYKVYKTK